jgi:hypothetical protein
MQDGRGLLSISSGKAAINSSWASRNAATRYDTGEIVRIKVAELI